MRARSSSRCRATTCVDSDMMYAEDVVESLRSNDDLNASLPCQWAWDWLVTLTMLAFMLSWCKACLDEMLSLGTLLASDVDSDPPLFSVVLSSGLSASSSECKPSLERALSNQLVKLLRTSAPMW